MSVSVSRSSLRDALDRIRELEAQQTAGEPVAWENLLRELRQCAASWEPQAVLLGNGNLTAARIVALCDHFLTHPRHGAGGVMECVVMFSGGAQSFVAAQRAVERFGSASTALLFADTSAEDADLYRFVIQAAASIGAPLHIVRDGRTPQQVLRDRKFLGSGRGAPCSEFLKRKPMDAWVAANAPDAVQVYGLSWEEMHRVEAIQRAKAPASVWCPLAEAPYLTRDDVLAAVEASGVAMPRLYRDGFAHNNCGGACVRAGQGAWLHLLNMKPDLYAEWEKWEQDMRASVGPYAILRDRTGGDVRPLPLVELRSRRRSDVDLFDIAGCGCATEYDDSAQPGNGGGEVGQ